MSRKWTREVTSWISFMHREQMVFMESMLLLWSLLRQRRGLTHWNIGCVVMVSLLLLSTVIEHSRYFCLNLTHSAVLAYIFESTIVIKSSGVQSVVEEQGVWATWCANA